MLFCPAVSRMEGWPVHHDAIISIRSSAPTGMCVKLRRRHKCQKGSAERDKVPRAILVHGLLGAPASRLMPQVFCFCAEGALECCSLLQPSGVTERLLEPFRRAQSKAPWRAAACCRLQACLKAYWSRLGESNRRRLGVLQLAAAFRRDRKVIGAV